MIGYRRKTVYTNLKNSFPNKAPKKIKQIERKFYKNFCDYLVETIKAFSISQSTLDKRHTYSNLELLKEVKEEKKDALLMVGHIFNWEWFIGLVKHVPAKNTAAIYHKIRNNFWNNKINDMRSKFESIPLNMKASTRYILKQPNNGEHQYLFVADQSPYKSRVHYSLNFLNQETPVFIGFDKLAVKKNMAVIYLNTKKIKRGYYHTTLQRIEPNNKVFEPNEVVHQFYNLLEKTIHENPDNWLWTHKRWKYKKGTDY